MVALRNYAEVETWSVKDLIDSTSPEPSGKRKVTIPEFQRRLVWTKEKQEKLIVSIKSGFPFGSLLLYEDVATGNQNNSDAKRYYKLIDGLQRTQALRKYNDDPNSFFIKDDVPEDFVSQIIGSLGLNSDKDTLRVQRYIANWVRGLRGFAETDGWGTSGLINTLVRDVLEIEENTDEFHLQYGKLSGNGLLQTSLANFLKTVREDADINGARIPVIIYAGDSSNLPSVFELLNSQGTVLSRYEIFAAQWIDKREKIENDEIREAIWLKYQALENEGFTLDVVEEAPNNRDRVEREYTLFEYLFGFGQFLSKKFPFLFRATDVDRPSSAGFNLVSACIDINVKEMDKLPKQIQGFDRSELEKKILEATTFVDKSLSSVLSVKDYYREKVSIYHSEFQIISLIATAFRVRYDLNDNLKEIGGWRNNWEKLQRNLLMYYLYDILRDYWRGSGDSKLHDNVVSLRYLNTPPSENNWRQTLDTWFSDNQITLEHTKRYVRDQTPEILILKYIYAHKFTLVDNTKTYHIEHIVPVSQITSAMPNGERWQINVISNLALLEGKENTEKGKFNFKQYLQKLLSQGEIDDDEYETRIKTFENQLICPVEVLPETITRKNYEDFILRRFDLLKNKFISSWRECIPNSNSEIDD